MARIQATDFLLSFRFQVRMVELANGEAPDYLNFERPDDSQAGFQSVTLPEMTIEATEYREGTYKYTRKFPGPPTISEVSCMRGVVRADTSFFDWCVAAISGSEYRATINIAQFTREDLPQPETPFEFTELPTIAARNYTCYECVPVRVKPAGDLDATSGEVSMAEVDFAPEYFAIVEP